MKKVLLSFLLTLLPMLASAEAVEIDGIWYNLIPKAKEAEVTSNPNTYSGDVVIPPSVKYNGQPYSVTSIGGGAFYNCSSLTSVTIPNSVTSIGDDAFYYCFGLTSVNISDLAAWCNIKFGSNPLDYANHLYINGNEITNLVIPNSVTSISQAAFSRCSGLTSVTIPNSVTSIGKYAFYYCSGLTSVAIPNSVTSIGDYAFCNCSGLTSVAIPNSVTYIGKLAFEDCTSLSSVIIGSSVTSIGSSAFGGCSGLTSVTIPNSVESIDGSAFYGCSGLTSVTIPSSVTSIGDGVFGRCSGLTSVTIPNSVTYIGKHAFKDSGLLSVTIPNSVTGIGSEAFGNCENLTDVYCLAEKLRNDINSGEGIYTYSDAFKDSYPQSMTLHVPASAIEAYKGIEPWSSFKSFVPIGEGEIPETPKCATPTISLVNGEIIFGCETEGAEFVSEVTVSDAKAYYDNKVSAPKKFKVTVHATKSGYDDSEEVTEEFDFSGDTSRSGDVDGNGKVDVADHVKLSDIIMNK